MSADARDKSVLVLGAGYCCKPLVVYLAQHGYHVTVGSRTLDKAQELCTAAGGNATPRQVDVSQADGLAALEELTPSHCMVISMLPWLLHGAVAEVAARHGAHFLTTSYVQPGVRAIEETALAKGLVVINECGVDPGTDHMSAMRVIDEAHRNGGRVVSFSSFCGGLPAPDCNDNPFGYKFSWAPRGVLLASAQPAKHYRDGAEVSIAAGTLFRRPNFVQGVRVETDADFLAGVEFEGYPNRDSTPYRELYGIPEAATLVRGTYRYTNWCDIVQAMSDLGMLNTDPRSVDAHTTYAQLLRELAAAKIGASNNNNDDDDDDVEQLVRRALGLTAEQEFIVAAWRWLGLFDADVAVASVSKNAASTTLLDVVCDLMQQKMVYRAGERDMIVLQHSFVIEYPDRRDYLTSSLVALGSDDGETAMSRTVAIPCAIAARLVLEKKFTRPGLSIPTIPELYQPILDELDRSFNIRYVERLVRSEPI